MVSFMDATVFLLCFAFAGVHVVDYLLAISPNNAAGAAVALLALATAYFTGVTLVYLQIAAAPPAPVSQGFVAFRLLASMACVLLLLVAIMPLAPWLFSM